MSEQTTAQAEQYTYQAEMRQLLHLIVHSLYTNQEIFLRELISNASDALNKARFRSLTDKSSAPAPEYKIIISADADAQTLSVEDTGIGMTREDLVERIGTVASSGTLAFLEELKESGKPLDANLIGQFGVGFYSCFMVAGEVQIDTLHVEADAEPLLWTSDGQGTFTIAPGSRSTPGTTVTLHLKEDAKELAGEYRIRQIIRKYSNFVDFPIHVGDKAVNTVKALWKKRKEDVSDEERAEFYKFVSGDFADPLGHLHLRLEGLVSFDALLFVPAKVPASLYRDETRRQLHLYSRGVFVRDDADDLLPEYFRFIRGVVDTDDLPLNVSREVTQSSAAASKIRTALTNKILGLLTEWSTGNEELYERFFKEFGTVLKAGLWSDFQRREKLLSLMRYPSTKTEGTGTTTLQAYIERMQEGQDAIYYLLAESLDTARRSPNLEVFARKDIEVLLLADSMDAATIPSVQEFDSKPFKSVTQADLDLDPGEDSLPGDDVDRILALFRLQLEDRVKDVVASKRLVDSAATLVASADGVDLQVERVMQAINEDFEAGKKVLEINTGHPLMKNLLELSTSDAADRRIEQVIDQVYEGALLLDGELREPSSYVERMTRFMVAATLPA
ncbi:MAG: molecular chaperone HtpG [Bacteroidota bacterium]|nr:molecular chaperone HtpG [Bacteroidota bacterium]MDE2956628.1 molecular chaperone HtpG [Bacteroidota bacterium]